MKYTPDHITSLGKNEVFVFGSNLAGRHGAGAAAVARSKFGARLGVGVGPTGRSYALPTKDESLRTLSVQHIQTYVDSFLKYAAAHPEQTFYVTQIGCGLAGHHIEDIAPLFAIRSPNVIIPRVFDLHLSKTV